MAALLAADDIDLVLNLTVPNAHFGVSIAALEAGKHVFTEKPLAATAAEGCHLVTYAEARGLAIGSAPDTFLGAAGRHARQLVDAGAIGRPVTGTAFMMGRGMEHWHPNPSFYYQPGAGPVLDMGPYYLTMLVHLLGPACRVMAMSAIGVARAADHGRRTAAEHAVSGRHADHGQCAGRIRVRRAGHGRHELGRVPPFHPADRDSTAPKAPCSLPDPDTFGGPVALSRVGVAWDERSTADAVYGAQNWPYAAPDRANYRMLGVADLARALARGPPAACVRRAWRCMCWRSWRRSWPRRKPGLHRRSTRLRSSPQPCRKRRRPRSKPLNPEQVC